jgi:hypothetical protein
MRIRTAIFVVYVGASALGLAAMMGLVLRDVRLRYVESMRRTLGDTAAYMAAFAAPAAPEDDWTARLATLPRQADLLRVFACDAGSRVIFDSAGRDVGQTYEWPMRGGGRWASENYNVSNVAVVEGELRVASRVLSAGKHVGWVGVGRPLAAVEEGVREARWRLVSYIGFIAGGMLVLGWWIVVFRRPADGFAGAAGRLCPQCARRPRGHAAGFPRAGDRRAWPRLRGDARHPGGPAARGTLHADARARGEGAARGDPRGGRAA